MQVTGGTGGTGGTPSGLLKLLTSLCGKGRGDRYLPFTDSSTDADIHQGPFSEDVLLEVIKGFANKQDAVTMRLVCRLWRKTFDSTVGRLAIHGTCSLPRQHVPCFPQLRHVGIDHGHAGTVTNLLPMLLRSRRLHTLHCSHSSLTALPAGLCDMTQLQQLAVTRTALSTIPAQLHHLLQLQVLDLSGNRLVEVPATIGVMGTLTHLDLSDNKLVCLPEGLCGLRQLNQLNLNNNCLTELPDALGDLHELTSLRMNNNRLKALPRSMTRCRGLTLLGVFASFSHTPRNENHEIVRVLADLKMHCADIHLVAEEVVSTLIRHRVKRLRAAAAAAGAAGEARDQYRTLDSVPLVQLVLS